MKASELRLGNYVQYIPIASPVKIVATDLRNSSIAHANVNVQVEGAYQPINITEKWLLKFRFLASVDKNGLCYVKKHVSMTFKVSVSDSGAALSIAAENHEGCSLQLLNHRYVHQLQNLYFAVTGEEL